MHIKGKLTYCDEGIKWEKSIQKPTKSIREAKQGEKKRHILHAFGCDHQFLCYIHENVNQYL